MAYSSSDGQRAKSGRWLHWRSALWLVPLLLLAFVIVSDLFGWAYLRKPAAALLSAKLERPVEIGKPFRIHLRKSLQVQVGSLSIDAPEWSDQPYLAAIKSLAAEVDWGILIGRPPVIHRLSVESADVHVERDAQGRESWSLSDKAEDDSSDLQLTLPVIQQLSIGEAKIAIDDAQTELRMQMEAHTERGAATDLVPGGDDRLVASGSGSWRGDPLSFKLHADALQKVLDSGALGEVDIQAKLNSTELEFVGSVSDLPQFSKVSGKLSAKGDSLGELTSIPGLTLPSTPPYRLEGTVQRDEQTITVTVSKAEVGSSSLTANLEYLGAETPPLLRGSIAATRLVLQDLGPSIGGNGDKGVKDDKDDKDDKGGKADETLKPEAAKPSKRTRGAAKARAKGRVLPTREFDLPILRAMHADVAIDLQQLDFGTKVLKPLTSVEAKLLLQGGILRLENLKASVAGGSVGGLAELDGSVPDETPLFNAKLKWQRVDLENWLDFEQGKYFVAGRFSGATDLEGRGSSAAAILDSLSGSVKGRIDGGSISHQIVELAGLDVAQALGLFVSGDERLKLSCALVDLAATKGTVRSNLFVLNTSDTLFFVDGNVNFTNERLDLRVVQSPKDWSPLSLRSPLTIGGTFAKPVIGVEPLPIALKVLSSVVLAAVSPLAALLPLIEPKETSVGAGCDPAIKQFNRHVSQLKSDEAADLPSKASAEKSGVLPRPGQIPGERP